MPEVAAYDAPGWPTIGFLSLVCAFLIVWKDRYENLTFRPNAGNRRKVQSMA
jgi:hypothetical protein